MRFEEQPGQAVKCPAAMHELVIFDCDGVLVDSEVISNEVLARMLTREGLPTTLSEARRACQGLLLTDIRDQAEAKLGRPLPPDGSPNTSTSAPRRSAANSSRSRAPLRRCSESRPPD